MTRLILFFLASFGITAAQAQDNNVMEEFMYSSGKINVVIAVVLIIFFGLFIYLWRLDKKIKRMEEE